MGRFVDISHTISDGMVTYPGLAAPSIRAEMSFEASRAVYESGYEFQIHRIDMIANTGTYVDTPAHRLRDGFDLAGLELAKVADLDAVVVTTESTAIGAEVLPDSDLAGKAVLFRTGWSRNWGTPAYGVGHPHLAPDTAATLVGRGVALVGIDSLNVDATDDGSRPIHTALLAADIPILEHLTNLEAVPAFGSRLFAVPPSITGMASFPVRAFVMVDPDKTP